MQKQTQPAEPVRKANGSIWDNRFFLGIVSVLAAVLVWMVVSTFLDPQGSFVIKDVSVNYGYQSTIYTSKGLDIVDQQAVDNVQVQADGNGTLIGKLSSSDIMGGQNHPAAGGPHHQHRLYQRGHQADGAQPADGGCCV